MAFDASSPRSSWVEVATETDGRAFRCTGLQPKEYNTAVSASLHNIPFPERRAFTGINGYNRTGYPTE